MIIKPLVLILTLAAASHAADAPKPDAQKCAVLKKELQLAIRRHHKGDPKTAIKNLNEKIKALGCNAPAAAAVGDKAPKAPEAAAKAPEAPAAGTK